MGAYSLPIERPTCRCGKRATTRVYNRDNAHVADACARCATWLVAELNHRAVRGATIPTAT